MKPTVNTTVTSTRIKKPWMPFTRTLDFRGIPPRTELHASSGVRVVAIMKFMSSSVAPTVIAYQ